MGETQERDGKLGVSPRDQDTWDMFWFMERRRRRRRRKKTPPQENP
jgi:hypothetical protein